MLGKRLGLGEGTNHSFHQRCTEGVGVESLRSYTALTYSLQPGEGLGQQVRHRRERESGNWCIPEQFETALEKARSAVLYVRQHR